MMGTQSDDIRIISEAARMIEEGCNSESFRAWTESLPDEKKAVLVRATNGLPRVAPHPGPQSMAFNSPADVTGYGGAAGGGKAQPLDAKVLTPYGERKIGELENDDVICAPFGGTQRIRGHQPFRDWRVFRVHFDDGTSIDCSPEHEWFGVWESDSHLLQDRNDLLGGTVPGYETAQIKKFTENDYRFLIPVADAAEGDEMMGCDFDPVILAAWITYGVAPISDKSDARIVLEEDMADLANKIASKIDSSIIIKRNGKAIIPIPGLIHERLIAMSIPFYQGDTEYPFWRLSDTALVAPKKWRESLIREIMGIIGSPSAEANDGQYQEWTASCPFAEVMEDAVSLARRTGAWVKPQGKGFATFRLPVDSDYPPRMSKVVESVEETDDYVDMRCISVSDSTGSYITNDGTITHNSALIGMLAYLEHKKSVVFRHDAKQLTNLIRDLKFFAGSQVGLNMQEEIFKFHGREDHFIEWGGIADERSLTKWRGREHDLFAVDEVTEVPEKLVMTLMTWMRTSTEGQRCRAIFTFNPPGAIDEVTGIIPQGRWVIKYFAPWIDESYEERDLQSDKPLRLGKALPGELRYFITDSDGREREVIGVGPHEIEVAGEKIEVMAQSRTFIPALFTDNPKLPKSYRDTLAKLGEPERSALMQGKFTSDIADSPYRVFPTDWVEAAMRRWTPEGKNRPIRAIGCDVSRGGSDQTCIAPRHVGLWFDKIVIPKRTSANSVLIGDDIALNCMNCLNPTRDTSAIICIDANGIGASPYDSLVRLCGESRVRPVMFSNKTKRLLPGYNECANMRAFLYWLLRHLLDPKYRFDIALPPDEMLKEEMVSIHKEPNEDQSGKIQIEKKDRIRERLRRSPDRLDAVVTSLYTMPEDSDPEWEMVMGFSPGEETQGNSNDRFMAPPPRGQDNAYLNSELNGLDEAWMAV